MFKKNKEQYGFYSFVSFNQSIFALVISRLLNINLVVIHFRLA